MTDTDRRLRSSDDLAGLVFGPDGLLPVVAQDADGGRILMVAWANQEALERSLATGEMHFWSRTRSELWKKGETSGNVLRVQSLHADCDGDTVLARVHPTGPACHTGEASCFGAGSVPEASARSDPSDEADDALDLLWEIIDGRADELPEGSYTTRLLTERNLRLKKIGEEAAELVVALTDEDADRATEEAADLLYHLLVALRAAGSSLDRLRAELGRRRGASSPSRETTGRDH